MQAQPTTEEKVDLPVPGTIVEEPELEAETTTA